MSTGLVSVVETLFLQHFITILLSQVVLDVLEMLEKPLPSMTLNRITRLLDPWFRC